MLARRIRTACRDFGHFLNRDSRNNYKNQTKRDAMRNTLFYILIICGIVSNAFAKTYSTSFPLTENPISEGGMWINGATDGLDWGNVSTTPGQTHPHPGTARYADATALLKGTWGPNQTAQGTVWVGNAFNYPEVEIRLRSTISKNVCNGYEITFSLAPNSYLIIVRWNGPLANYTMLADLKGSKYQAKAGDVVKATIEGNVIKAYKNGQLMGQATDSTYTSGNPGMGFNEQDNGDYGYINFMATDSSGETNARTVYPGINQAHDAQIMVNGQNLLLSGAVSGDHIIFYTIDGKRIREAVLPIDGQLRIGRLPLGTYAIKAGTKYIRFFTIN